ncbi:MAG: 2-oxoacid:acceptor oxidoreductase family protein [Desulfurococcales archaeon]|nr:2-oxoacid:acceptor oxidoreductase family protein [Desulfurococcales archaeon]
MLVEIRFHGRGGQGAVTAANLLANAAVREGKYAQAFPYFGAERRGAPVVAFARISDRPIETHSRIENPDVVVVLDPKLFELADVTVGLKDDGVIVANARERPPITGNYRVYCVDATSIALRLGLVVSGWPVVNTVMLGALAKALGLVKLESVIDAVMEQFPGRIGELNAEAIREAARQVREC